jgi:hypothetical protein
MTGPRDDWDDRDDWADRGNRGGFCTDPYTFMFICGKGPVIKYGAFMIACAEGRPETAKVLHENYKFTKEEVSRDDNSLLRHTIEKGHRDAAGWLRATFDLP